MKTEIFVKDYDALSWVSIAVNALRNVGYMVETKTCFGGYGDCPIKVEIEYMKKED